MTATKLLFRFDETVDLVRPADTMRNLDDLMIEAGLVAPAIASAAIGRGRRFVAATGHGYRALDTVAGSTLLTRDCSVQAIVNWQLAAQNTAGNPGTLYARGKGTAAAEYMSAGIELRVVNAAVTVGEIRWQWQDTAGVLKTQTGGHFQPHASEYQLLTATRRWISATEVVLRYYLGDRLLSEVISVDGSIGGGTTGTTSIGARFTGGAWARFLDGTIDELRVVDYELSLEEIAATFQRITVQQPRGYQLLVELHDPGFPISSDGASRVQRETRQWGHGLGFAAAQAENIRNVLPHRAYGDVLAEWETVTKQSPKPSDSVDTRRARIVARLRRTDGVTLTGVGSALRELVDTDPANLEILAFDQTIREGFTALAAERWRVDPAADFTILASALRVQPAAGTYSALADWRTALVDIGGDGRGARVLCKITPTTFPSGSEAGVLLGNRITHSYVAAYLAYYGGNYFITSTSYVAGIATATIGTVDLGAVKPANVWIAIENAAAPGIDAIPTPSNFTIRYSVTSAIAGFVTVGVIAFGTLMHYAGTLYKTSGAIATAADVRFDDAVIRAPGGSRSMFFYVYRNPTLPGRLDYVGANSIIRALKQAHTHAAVITSKSLLCDDASSLCDSGPMGGI